MIANGLVSLGDALGIGYAGLYGAVYLATVIISNIVTNNAAAAVSDVLFPSMVNISLLTQNTDHFHCSTVDVSNCNRGCSENGGRPKVNVI